VTVIKVGPNVVTQVRGDADGYAAVQIGYGEIDPRKVNKPMKGHFEKAGVTPRRHLVELRTADAADYSSARSSPSTPSRPARGRRHRHDQGQGLRRCHEASRLRRRLLLARCPPQPPQARLDRRLRHPGRVFKGHAHGRPHGRRAPDHPEPHRSTPSTPRRACCSSRVPFPAPAVASSSCAPRRRGPDHHGDQDLCVTLPAEIFDVQVNVPLIHQVVAAQLAAARQGTHATKTRGNWSPAVARSRTARRAPAAPVRARPVRRSSPAVASSTARSRVTTRSAPPRR
jgi:hypothetical protein